MLWPVLILIAREFEDDRNASLDNGYHLTNPGNQSQRCKVENRSDVKTLEALKSRKGKVVASGYYVQNFASQARSIAMHLLLK